MKTHLSAVVLIPSASVWPAIQLIRQRFDRQFARWMPHVTLLYPFWPRDLFDQAAAQAERACRDLTSFSLVLRQLHWFSHGRGRYTMWFRPEPAEPICRLQAALQACFAECDDVSRHHGGFTPHLSCGQAHGKRQLLERTAQIRASWQPLAFEVSHVALIAREAHGPFEVVRSVALGR